MGLMTERQIAAIKALRARDWTSPFTLHQYAVQPIGDYYGDAVPTPPVSYLLSGAYAWFGQIDQDGRPGGMVQDGDLRLACDVDLYPLFLHSGAQLEVDGFPCAILSTTPLHDSGECLIIGKRAR